MRAVSLIVPVVCFALLGCSSSSSTKGEPTESTPGELTACSPDPAKRDGPCLDEVGLKICPADTGFAGDGLAICEPESGDAMVIHYGPSDYDDPVQIEAFSLAAGAEDENCTYVRTANEQQAYVDSYSGRMRPHSHHLIITQVAEEGFVENPLPAKCNLLDVVGAKWLVGSQEPQIDVFVSGAGKEDPKGRPTDPAAPDFQLAQVIPARQPLRVDLHYVNSTEDTLLREAWVNLTTTDEAHASTIVDMITFFQGRISIPPHAKMTTPRARCVAKSDRYLGLVTGHAHSRMTRESVWLEKAGQEPNLVYETYNWNEPGELFYRDGLTNPTPSAETKQFGGVSGYQLVKEGEAVSFECAYDNPTDETIVLGETTKQEMCNVFGMYYPTDGDAWSCACIDTTCLAEIPPGVDVFNINQM